MGESYPPPDFYRYHQLKTQANSPHMRYERKYRIEGLSPQAVLQVLRLHPASLRPIYQERQVNNIYFDTPGLSTYKDNVSGRAERRKYRVRWYGDEIGRIEAPHLEQKIRQMELGSKLTFEVNRFGLSNLKTLCREVNNLCPEAGNMLQPMLLNSYRRIYMQSSDQKFRLTLDYQLGYTPLLYGGGGNKHSLMENGVVIVELKYDATFDELAENINRYLPFRRTKNSKYVSGIELCYW